MASDDEGADYETIRQSRNRKERKAGLDHGVFKGIEKKGFRQPTPIQRKTIPCILDGKDVVAMSRTGSGKTAAFVIPMLQRLKKRDTKGIRALLVSPTRELALQTFRVVKELGKYTGLHCACLVGGDSLDDQFATLHESPDILLATPGRLLHIAVEMNLKFNNVEYVVFDEADRLFEMGFLDQLTDILKRLPESRQTLLFSATLPKMLVDFAKAGLTDPMLIRLNVDDKVSELLSMVFVTCRPDDRVAAVVGLAKKTVVEEKQAIVFCATMKHVEYLVAVLNRSGIECSFIYSQLDHTARNQNIARFRDKKVNILVVTDVAARGVDIPLLDTVINMHFPPKPKLFVHRAGRVARAGRSGTAISLVTPDELAYMTDLFLFLGKPLKFAQDRDIYDEKETLIGRLPERFIETEVDFLLSIHDNNVDLHDLQHKSTMALSKYCRTRPPPSAESARRVKEELRVSSSTASFHPYLKDERDKQRSDVLSALANYKTSATIFELHTGSRDKQVGVMKNMRKLNGEKIRARLEEEEKRKAERKEKEEEEKKDKLQEADEETLSNTFTQLIGKAGKKQSRREKLEEEKKMHFIAYTAQDATSERDLAVDFSRQAEGVSVDIVADDDRGMYKQSNVKKWDRKLKRFKGQANDDPAKKKIRTEDGTWIPASYKTGRYDEWVKKQKLGFKRDEEEGEEGEGDEAKEGKQHYRHNRKTSGKGAKVRNEVLRPEQILKTRKKKEKLQAYQQHRREDNLRKKTGGRGGARGGGSGRGTSGRGRGRGGKFGGGRA